MLVYKMKNQNYAPIVLFVYNRPLHTRQTIEALQRNDLAKESDLIVYSDAQKMEAHAAAVNDVRQYVREIDGFKSVTVIERETNFGLANSIISGVAEVVGRAGRIIVLEDDLITTPYFLKYMNDALNCYENEERVVSIHGYMFPVAEKLPETFFLRDPGCWGWATWKRGWDLFEPDGAKLMALIKEGNMEREFNFAGSYDYVAMLESQVAGRNNSWAVRWYASAFLLNKLTLYPGRSLVQNIGGDGSGQHEGTSDSFSCELAIGSVRVGDALVEEDMYVRSILIQYLMSIRGSLIRRLAKHVSGIFSNLHSMIFRK